MGTGHNLLQTFCPSYTEKEVNRLYGNTACKNRDVREEKEMFFIYSDVPSHASGTRWGPSVNEDGFHGRNAAPLPPGAP